MRFDNSMIPAEIDTMERLACWALCTLNFVLFETTYKERTGNINLGDDGVQPVIERVGPILSQQKDARLIMRASFLVHQDFASGAYPTDWAAVKELATGEPPIGFLRGGYEAP